MRYGLTRSTPPTAEPLTIQEARKQVELSDDYTRHDDDLFKFIRSARERAEAITGRQICTATWDLYLDRFPQHTDSLIYLPKPPLQSVSSITYVDSAGDTQTWSSASYDVSTHREPGCIRLGYGKSFPTARDQLEAIRVRYVAGYGSASAVPFSLKAAMLLMVAHWFAHREAVNIGNIVNEIPMSASDLLTQWTVGDEFVDYAGCEYVEAA